MPPRQTLLSRCYRELRIPGVIAGGEKDRMVWRNRHADRLAHELPPLACHVVSGAGGMLHEVVPQEAVHAIHTVAMR